MDKEEIDFCMTGYVDSLKGFMTKYLPNSKDARLALAKLEECYMLGRRSLNVGEDDLKHVILVTDRTASYYDHIEVRFAVDPEAAKLESQPIDPRTFIFFVDWATAGELIEIRFTDQVIYRRVIDGSEDKINA
jgi:hypothetical protein